MRILVVNDDGIHAEGMHLLVKAVSKIADIYVVAPDRERSASSNSITIHHPLRARKVNLDFAKEAWEIDGTPADCVKIAISSLLDFEPDFILSGVNCGANLGIDVLYSGTVAAAMEGYINGIFSMAISSAAYKDNDFEAASKYTVNIVKSITESFPCERMILNINIPNFPTSQIKGLVYTRLGDKKYQNIYDMRVDPRGGRYYWLAGDLDKPDKFDNQSSIITDIEAVEEGYISLTPINIDMTSYKLLDKISDSKLSEICRG